MSKKLSDLTSQERIERWVAQHTLNLVSALDYCHAPKVAASERRLIEKLQREVREQREVAIREFKKLWTPLK